MSEIKSFLQWLEGRQSEYNQRIKTAFDSLCQDEIEMMHQIVDMSLDYQDDGATFEFFIMVGKFDLPNNWVQHAYAIESEVYLYFKIPHGSEKNYENSLKKCDKGGGAPFLRITGDHISKVQISEFHKRIKSAFPDWETFMSASSHDEDAEFTLTIYRM